MGVFAARLLAPAVHRVRLMVDSETQHEPRIWKTEGRIARVDPRVYEQLAPGLREGREEWLRRAVLPALAPAAEVRFAGAVYRREDVEPTVADYEAAGVEALLVVCLTYSPSQIALPALRRHELPIIVWNTQELWAVDGRLRRREDGRTTTASTGRRTWPTCCCAAACRFTMSRRTWAIRRPGASWTTSSAAAAAVAGCGACRLGLLGYPFPGMGDFAVDTTHLAATLGCSWKSLAVEAVQPAGRGGRRRCGRSTGRPSTGRPMPWPTT